MYFYIFQANLRNMYRLVTLKSQLETFDVLRIDPTKWYDATSASNVQAVIGIKQGEEVLDAETPKRRRVR
ncbi:hypothetical protein OQA88_2216 [Cercophora sp. LCS_1]